MTLRIILFCLCVGPLSSCASDAQDRPVTLALANAGTEPLRCQESVSQDSRTVLVAGPETTTRNFPPSMNFQSGKPAGGALK